MWDGQTFLLKEYYIWRKKVETRYPWLRQYVNTEFLNYEQKRIKMVAEWRKKFRKAGNNEVLGNVTFYILPLEITSSWKAAIADTGKYIYIGLSALFNSLQEPVIGLLSTVDKSPQEYGLIEITKSKRMNLFNRKLKIIEPVLLIEEWAPLSSDNIYIDVPHEKKIIKKVIEENLIHDEQISSSLQSPIISAPPVSGSIGGISLSSVSLDSTFAKELAKIILLMVPPEYRILPPPRSVYNGRKLEYLTGVKYHLAERPYYDRNVLSSIYSKQCDELIRELSLRYKFHGEFSIFSAINPDRGNVTQIWKELLRNFTATEITMPQEIEKLVDAEVDLNRLKRVISEDLWIQVVKFHQYEPGLNVETDRELIKIINLLKEDFDTLLSDVHRQEDSREYLVRSMLYQIGYNLKRIAQSFARADEKNQLDSKHLKKARNLIIDNFTGFIYHPRFQKIRSIMEIKREGARFSIVQTEIMNNPLSSTAEIFEAVKSTNLFDDIYDLQRLLDWLHKEGYVIRSFKGGYQWV